MGTSFKPDYTIINSPKVRAAVVGVGYLGNFHAQKLKNNENVELVAVCDSQISQSKKIAESLNVKSLTNYRELLGHIDCVTIASSTKSHFEVAEFFLNNQVHVLVEKPIAETVAQASHLVQLAKKNKLLLSVGHIERFNPTYLKLKETIKESSSFELIRHAPFRRRGADVSVIHDLMIHDVDLMLWLGDKQKKDLKSFSVVARPVVSNDFDVCQSHFLFNDGVQFFISVSRASSSVERKIKVLEKNNFYIANSADMTIEKCYTNRDFKQSEFDENQFIVDKVSIEKQDALQLEVNDFISAVQGRSQIRVSGQDGLEALEIVEMLYKKAKGESH